MEPRGHVCLALCVADDSLARPGSARLGQARLGPAGLSTAQADLARTVQWLSLSWIPAGPTLIVRSCVARPSPCRIWAALLMRVMSRGGRRRGESLRRVTESEESLFGLHSAESDLAL